MKVRGPWAALVRIIVIAALFVTEVVALPGRAGAQAPPQMSATLEPEDVFVGEPFTVELTVLGEGGGPEPSDPALALPPGLTAGRPSIGSQMQVSFTNGRLSRHSGITATWRVIAAHEGKYTIAGPIVSLGTQRFSANALHVVVHAGTPGASPRQRRQRGNPFDPFGMMPQLPGFGDEPPSVVPPAQTVSPELSLDIAPDPTVFLRAVTDKTAAVVGEQVTLTIYLYVYAHISIDQTEFHDPPLVDFVARDLTSPTDSADFKAATVGGVVFRVLVVRKVALFPLKAGALEIGPARSTFRDPSGSPRSIERASLPIIIHVEEPPVAGRPAGYALGNVGQFSMTAAVEPRSAEVGGAIAVTVTIKGIGNLPTALPVPATTAVEWLDPQIRETVEPDANGRVGGSRTFTYLVRPKRAGAIDLGSIVWPYWDPTKRAYVTARADLGAIQVAPSATPQTQDIAEAKDPFAGLGPIRPRLASVAAIVHPLSDRPLYWVILFGAPLTVVLASLLVRGTREARRRFGQRQASPQLAVDRALSDARNAIERGDSAQVAGSLERAMHTAVEASTALRSRALLLEEMKALLVARGLDASLAERIREIFGRLESLRFAPEGDATRAALSPLVHTVESVVRDLRRAPGRRT